MSLRDKFLEAVAAKWSALRASRKTRVLTGMAAGFSLIAFGAAGVAPNVPDASDLPVRVLVQELALPDLATQIQSLSTQPGQFISEERVRPGDSLAALLDRLGVDDPQAASFIRSDATASKLMNLRPGRRMQATVNQEGKLLSATALLGDGRDELKRLLIQRQGDALSALQTDVRMDSRVEMRSGEIRSSLFAATDAAQVPDAVAMQIVDIFSSDIDFASDLRKGDRFQVIYETFWNNGEAVRTGRILAVEFRNAGKNYQAVWYSQNGSEQGAYYDLHGKALKKAFLKSPLQFSRVTSGFAMRLHPVSGLWKQHKGIDFAAPVGTPIRAASNGMVDFAGVQGGYGNMVILRHGPVYSTVYAHMSRIASVAKRGTIVSQGDVIGYVGTSGWSTGPHLHYEFRVNNDARDPNTIATPPVPALAEADLQTFHRMADDMNHRFALMSAKTVQLAAR